jgi:hypothetical protein
MNRMDGWSRIYMLHFYIHFPNRDEWLASGFRRFTPRTKIVARILQKTFRASEQDWIQWPAENRTSVAGSSQYLCDSAALIL